MPLRGDSPRKGGGSMGDWFQDLVAPDVVAAEAKAVGGRMLAWLVGEGIVLAGTRDCVFGADGGIRLGRGMRRRRGWWTRI